VIAGNAVTASYVSLLEAGERVPTLDVVVHVAQQLGTTVAQLLDREPDGVTERPSGDRSEDAMAVLLAQQAAQESVDSGDFAAARDTLAEALESAAAAGAGETAVQLGLRLQSVLTALGASSERLALLTRLMAMPVVTDVAAVQVVLRSHHASALRDLGRLGEARVSALLALGQAREPGSRGTPAHVRCLGVLVSTLCELDDLAQVDELVTEMLALAAHGHRPGLRGRAHWLAALAYAQLDRPGAAVEQIRAAIGVLRSPELHLGEWVRFCRSVATVLLDQGGATDEALTWLLDAEHTAAAIGLPAETAATMCLRARFSMASGDTAAAAASYAKAAADGALGGRDLVHARLGYADAIEELGRVDEARDVLRQTAELCEQIGALQIAVRVWRRLDGLRVD
jgi:tetratricopeptide (TPR) repeat protein